MKTGEVYLMADPEQDSSRAVDVRRIWLPRVKVVLVKKHPLALNAHRRYEVMYQDRVYFTGRIDPIRRGLLEMVNIGNS